MRLSSITILIFICITVFAQNNDKHLRKAYSRKSIDILNDFLGDWNADCYQLSERRPDSLAKYDELIKSFYDENNVRKLNEDDYVIFDYRDIVVQTFQGNDTLENEISNIMDTLFFDISIDLDKLSADSTFFREYKYEKSIIRVDSITNYIPKQVDNRTLLLSDNYYDMISGFLQGFGDDMKKKEFLRKRISGFYQDGRSFTMNKKINKIFVSSNWTFAVIDWFNGYCWGQEVYLVYSGKWIRIKELIEICE